MSIVMDGWECRSESLVSSPNWSRGSPWAHGPRNCLFKIQLYFSLVKKNPFQRIILKDEFKMHTFSISTATPLIQPTISAHLNYQMSFQTVSPFEFFSNLFLHSIQNKLSLKISNCIISLDYVLPLNLWPVMLQIKQNPIKAPPWFCIWTSFTLPMPPSYCAWRLQAFRPSFSVLPIMA
jgi:hypothetical protein